MIIEESILINADLDKVWDTFTDLTCWQDWNNVIRDIDSRERCLTAGCKVVCNFRPFFFPINVSIEIKEVRHKESIVWFAKKIGLIAEHLFVFEKTKNGVIVISKETFKGFLVRNMGFLVPKKKIQNLTKAFLHDLKVASEKI